MMFSVLLNIQTFKFKMKDQTSTDPELLSTFKGHTSTVTSLAFNPNMQQLVSGSQDNSLLVHNLGRISGKTGRKIKPYKFIGHKAPIQDVAFSPNGNLIASASDDMTVRLWENNIQGNSVKIRAHSGAVRCVNFSKDGRLILTTSNDKTIKVWNALDKKFQYSLTGHKNWVKSGNFSPDSRMIVSGSDDRTMKLWDAEQRLLLESWEIEGMVNSVQFHPDGTCVVSGCNSGKIKVFDITSKKLIQHYDAHSGPVNSVAFHPTGFFLISASNDSKIKIWDLRKGKLLYTLYGHQGKCTCADFSFQGDYFCSGGSDNKVQVWRSNFQNAKEEVEVVDEDVVPKKKKIQFVLPEHVTESLSTIQNQLQFVNKQAIICGIMMLIFKRTLQVFDLRIQNTEEQINYLTDIVQKDSQRGRENEKRPYEFSQTFGQTVQ